MVIYWHVAYALIYRNIKGLMSERGLSIDHSTVNRWVVENAAQLKNNFKKNKRKTCSNASFPARNSFLIYEKFAM